MSRRRDGICCCRAAARCSDWRTATGIETHSCRACCPACSRPAPIASPTLPHDARLAALAFALGAYRFTRYRKTKDKSVKLVLPDGVDGDDLTRIADGVTLARDLINTPANDMGPADLEAAARTSPSGTARNSAPSSAINCSSRTSR